MRYFDENTKQLITSPDPDLGKQSATVDNSMRCDWIIDVEEQGHWEYYDVEDKLVFACRQEWNQELMTNIITEIIDSPLNLKLKVGDPLGDEIPPGGARWVIDVPEEGRWEWSTTSVYGVEPDLDDPPTSDHAQHPIHIEKVALWHTYTQAELDEIAEQKALNDAKQEASQAKQDQLDNIALSGSQSVIDHDLASCDIYNLFPSANAISDTKPYSRAFGRRVERGEITINDCPAALKTEIQQILDDKGLATTTANATNGTITGQGKSIMYPRNYNIGLELKPNDNYRVPTTDEFDDYFVIVAKNTSDQVITDFVSKYIYYYESLGNGKLQITIPKDCKSISIIAQCISKTEVAHTVNFEQQEGITYQCNGVTVTSLTANSSVVKDVKIVLAQEGEIVAVEDTEGTIYDVSEDNEIEVPFTKDTTISTEVLW